MHWKPRRPLGRRTVAGTAAALLIGGLMCAGPSVGMPAPTPPTAPTAPKQKVTQGQVDAASGRKAQLSAEVGRLSGEIAAAKIQLQRLEGEAEAAEQRYAYAYTEWQKAEAAAIAAEQAVQDARTGLATAHARFVQYVQAMYMSGGVEGTTGSLLTARDPSAMLEQASLENYQQQHKADAIGGMEAATVAKSNADAKARLAEARAVAAKAKAEIERKAAQAAVVAEQQQKAELEDQMAGTQSELNQAQAELAQLNYGRARWLDYLAAQRRFESAEHQYQADLDTYHQWQAQQARERERRRQAREARQHQQQHQPSGGGGSGGGGGGSHQPGPPSGGSWTPAKGRTAANRAMSQLGRPYAWAGGGAYGPGPGVCVPGDAWNDCNVIGFDCSGLAMYAWGASWWAHYAASQYSQAGQYHPGAGNLMPGDLIFWSNGGVSGIHHVAIYIGGGQMVEAPYSGGHVQIASIWEYGGFFGATRPFS